MWWADFSLLNHGRWTFATFFATLAVPALVYVAASSLLPGSELAAERPMVETYRANRRPFFVALVLADVASFVQTWLVDGSIRTDLDSGLKVALLAVALAATVGSSERVQQSVVVLNGLLLAVYVGLLFSNLPTN